jgi:protoporphyrinogen oxidase
LKEFGILGGGIAGLSLSNFLGEDSEVLEKDSECGGLSRTYEKDGFYFDLGGHILFSNDKEILAYELDILKGKTNQLFRKNSIWFKGRHVKYPFENGLAALDKEDIFDCVYNFMENPQRPQNNFEDWIYNTFGKGLAEKYMIPYNAKIWKMPPSEMGTAWVERVPKPPAADIVKSALGIETEGYVHQLYFHYPKEGGFQTLPRTFEGLIEGRIRRNFGVKEVRKTAQGWSVTDGKETLKYKHLINTMPIHDFVKVLKDVPPKVQRAIDDLNYNSLIVVMVGLNRESTVDKTSTYFPQEDLIFHRVVFFDYLGKNYVPPGCSSMVCEITSREDKRPWLLSDEEITEQVLEGLSREGFIKREEVITIAVQRTKYAYVLYDANREKNLAILYEWAKEEQIELCGRFAEFVYMNSDTVIRSAKNCYERLTGQGNSYSNRG